MKTTIQWHKFEPLEYSSAVFGGEHEFLGVNARDLRDGCIRVVRDHTRSNEINADDVKTWEAVFETDSMQIILLPSGLSHIPQLPKLAHIVVKMKNGDSFNIKIDEDLIEFVESRKHQALVDRKVRDGLRSGMLMLADALVRVEKISREKALDFANRYVHELNADKCNILFIDSFNLEREALASYKRYKYLEATGGDTSTTRL